VGNAVSAGIISLVQEAPSQSKVIQSIVSIHGFGNLTGRLKSNYCTF
jgi:hypothetical protein